MSLIKKSSKQAGIGLLELMLALAIIAILIVMATRYFSTASQSQQINVAKSQMIELRQAVYQVKQNNMPLDETSLKNFLTESVLTPGSGAFSSTWDTAKVNTGAFTLPNVPDKACTLFNSPNQAPEGTTVACASGVLTFTIIN